MSYNLAIKGKNQLVVEKSGKKQRGRGGIALEPALVIADYLNSLKARGYANATLISYQQNLAQFEHYLANRSISSLKQITKNFITSYQEHIMARSISTASKAMALRSVRKLFEHLIKTRYLLINPAEHLLPLRRPKRLPKTVLTIKEMQLLLAQPDINRIAGLRDRTIMQVLYATGIRCNELLSLDTFDADLKERTLYIRNGKNRKERMTPLGKAGVKYLALYLGTARPFLVCSSYKDHRMFLNIHGHPMTELNLQANLRRYRHHAGIKKKVSPHTFRRTCATHLLQQGVDIIYIQKLLGHQRLETTQIYTKVMPMAVKKMHEQIKSANP